MQNYVDGAMKIAQKLGIGGGNERHRVQSSSNNAKETLTLSGTLSEMNGKGTYPIERRVSQDSYSDENDDGELSQTSDNEQRNGDGSSSEITNTQEEQANYREVDDGTSDLSSEHNHGAHRGNPLFRSDAFEQIPSQNHQVMSANQGFRPPQDSRHNITNNTDQNLNENFRDHRNQPSHIQNGSNSGFIGNNSSGLHL